MEMIRPYLEIIYFITGGPVLACFGYLALQQITVAKDAARKASMREAFRLSAEQTHIYATEIVPRLDDINDLIREKNLTFFTGAKVTVEKNGVRVVPDDAEDRAEQLELAIPRLMDAVNRLETFSLFFTSKVAAENIAYSSIGSTYVTSVLKLMPFLVMSANNNNHTNIIELFHIWHSRLEKEKLEKSKKALEAQLNELKDEVIVPVGAD